MELLVIIIVLALIFDYINGFHDAANSIAMTRLRRGRKIINESKIWSARAIS